MISDIFAHSSHLINNVTITNHQIQYHPAFAINANASISSGADGYIVFDLKCGKLFIYFDKIRIETSDIWAMFTELMMFLEQDFEFNNETDCLTFNNYCFLMPIDKKLKILRLVDGKEPAGDWHILQQAFERYEKLKVFW